MLPFYLKLYDDTMPETRAGFDAFIARIVAAFEARGIGACMAPICRIAPEFEAAVAQFEKAGVDGIVTLHLAYSPSLESIDAFCGTKLPIIILDTTMDAAFGLSVSPKRIMFNHGVHGVMDFAAMLRRHRRPFEIVAGHVEDGRVMDRVAALARAAVAARRFRSTRALRVGKAFVGMGDFAVAEEVLAARLGIRVQEVGIEELDRAVREVSDAAVAKETASDRQRFACELPEEVHTRSVRVGLGLRRLLEDGGYNAHSVNFQAFDRGDRPASTVPFLEISKAMGRGIGYGGEGDVLTAALVGALAQAFEAVTFTEVFCPDWAGESLFLSHMGEISPTVAVGKPRIIEKTFKFGALNPAALTCAVEPGPAVFVNLTPGPDDTFSLVVAPVEVLAEDNSLDPAMYQTVRTWVRPQGGKVAAFLEAYSHAGGTHHSALVLGSHAAAIAAFGRMCGLHVVWIGQE